MVIFYRISAWLDHWFSSGFTGIEIFTYIQVCGVQAKLIKGGRDHFFFFFGGFGKKNHN